MGGQLSQNRNRRGIISPHKERFGVSQNRGGTSKLNVAWESKEQIMKHLKIQLEVYRNPNPTKVDEKNEKVVIFKTPTMRAKATVTVPPVPLGQIWTIGWVQSCYYMSFVNVYKEMGFSSWEFPQLNLGLPGVNDSDGQSYPFYGHDRETYQIAGPISRETTFTVSMSDSPASHVTLRAPSKHHSSGQVDLSCIKRKQKFNSWLVAFNETNGECIELKSLTWECDIHIRIDGHQSLGTRSFLHEPKIQPMPQVEPKIFPIPKVAKLPPDANHAQMLVWRPHHSRDPADVVIIVPPQVRGHTMPSEKELRNPQVYDLAAECLDALEG